MKKKITSFAFLCSLVFSSHSVFALELIDLATLDQEAIEESIGDKYVMPDYDAMLEDERSPTLDVAFAETGEAPAVTSISGNFSAEEEPLNLEIGEAVGENINENTQHGSAQEAAVIVKSSAPLAKSGPGLLIGILMTGLISMSFVSRRMNA